MTMKIIKKILLMICLCWGLTANAQTVVIPITEISSTAQFWITPQQFEILNEGVAKIRLSMTPMNHERTFKKDKIGKNSISSTRRRNKRMKTSKSIGTE